MSEFDFNTATEQLDVIPDKTPVIVQMHIRKGGAGEDGLLKKSNNGQAEGIDAEFIIVEGPYANRKVFAFMVMSGPTDGHAQAADITRSTLRAILESARGIKPKDVSEAAKKARRAALREFHRIRFMAKLGVEPAKDGYRAKNTLNLVITPDHKEWRQIEQNPGDPVGQPTPPTPTNQGGAIVKPAWA